MADDKKTDKTDEKILETARMRFEQCVTRDAEQRELQKRDLRFRTLDQWDPAIREAREKDITGPRPCLTIDKMGQYVQQIINQIRKNKPSGKVRGVDDKADPKTAQVFQGIVRHIDDISTTDIVYETAAEWAIDTGEGYWRYVTKYLPGSVDEQEIYRMPIHDGFSVYLGPHNMPDGSDAEYAFVFEDVDKKEFERKHPGKNVDANMFADVAGQMVWLPEDKVRICEYFYYDMVEENLVKLSDGSTMTREAYDAMEVPVSDQFAPMPKPAIVAERKAEKKVVKWCKLTGAEILEKQDWAGKYLPIVKVVGHQKIVDGKVKRWGLIRPAIDPCRLYNWTASVIAERVGLSPLNQFIASEGQISGHEKEWSESNRIRRAVLLYKREDVNGNATPPPQRTPPIQADSALANLLMVYEHDIQTALGMFKASVGEEQGDQSGRAIRALQSQSDTATFHFPNNLSASIRRGLEIEIDLIPKIYDTQRVARIIGEDGKARQVALNPNQQEAVREVKDAQGNVIKSIYNLNVGTYDVTATVGPSYATGRQEVAELTHEAMKNNPALVQIIGDLAYRSLDNPYADQIADRLKKLLPPALQDRPEGQNLPPQVIQQIEQMKQAIQAMQQENQQLKAGTMEGMAKVKADAEAKQAALAVQKENDDKELMLKAAKQEQEARLAREKAEADFALKKWIAEQEMVIADQKCEHERKIKQGQFDMELSKQSAEQEHNIAPKFVDAMSNVVAQFAQALEQQTQAQMSLVASMNQKKQVSMKMPDGRTASATVTVQ
jgi:hypothetical protein